MESGIFLFFTIILRGISYFNLNAKTEELTVPSYFDTISQTAVPFYKQHTFRIILFLVCIILVILITWILSRISTMSLIKRQIKQIEAARLEAERANRAKSQFLANMSHEIRTPINAIMGMDELILRQNPSEDIQKCALDIQHASNTLLTIVNDILDFSKIETGKMNIVCANYQTEELLLDLSTMLRIKSKEKNLKSHIIFDENIPKTLYGDETRIKQVLLNLLSNAIKYTETGSITFRVIVESAREDYVTLYMEVTDTGIGIQPNEIDRLFHMFERLDEKRNAKIQGTGLGLNIARQLLFLMGSKIEVKSEYGKGSTFSFRLRQHIVDNTPIGNINARKQSYVAPKQYAPTFSAPNANILLIDDNEMNRKVFLGLLAATKVQIDTGASGEECLNMITKKHYDIIYLDHMMPEMDGIETFQKMQEMNHMCKDTPVIILTANAVLGARNMYLEQGFHDYLSKPVSGEVLESSIRKYLPKNLLCPVVVEVHSSHATADSDTKKTAPTETRSETILASISPKQSGQTTLSKEIDYALGLSYSGNLTELYQELLEMFYQSCEDKIAVIDENYRKKDWKTYRVHVHALKSTAKSIGALSLYEEALRMENAAKDEDTHYIDYEHRALMAHYRKIASECEAHVAENSVHAEDTTVSAAAFVSSQDDSEAILQSLHALRTAIKNKEIAQINKQLDFLLSMSFPMKKKSLLEKIRFSVHNHEWDKVKKLLHRL